MHHLKEAVDWYFINRKVGGVSATLGNSRLLKFSEVRSAAEPAGILMNEPVPLNPYNVSTGGYDRDFEHAERIWDLQDLSEQSTGGVSAL